MSIHVERRQFLRLSAMAGLLAMPAGIARAQTAAGPAPPVQQLNAAADRRDAGRQRRRPFTQRFALLAPVVDQVFDLPTVLRTSVGLSWSSLPPDQQAALEQAFRRYTVATFVSNFDSYDGQRIEVLGNQRAVMPGEVVVPTQIVAALRQADAARLRDAADAIRLARGRCARGRLDQSRRRAAVGLPEPARQRRPGADRQPAAQGADLVRRRTRLIRPGPAPPPARAWRGWRCRLRVSNPPRTR